MTALTPPAEISVFSNYKIYKSFNKPQGRQQVKLLYKDDSRYFRTMNYSRYIMCLKENRILEPTEHVDHIDGNKLNDSMDNLQIMTRAENLEKYYKMASIGEYAENYDGNEYVAMTVSVSRGTRKRLKHLAADEDRSVQDILNEMIEREFK